jgi:hypothetical protein
MDVQTAFRNGHLKEIVYMRQPRGFVEPSKTHLYCRLIKSLYGLRQNPCTWYERIDLELVQYGMVRSNYDSNMYHLRMNSDTIIFMVYVDDLFITGSSDSLIAIVFKAVSTLHVFYD